MKTPLFVMATLVTMLIVAPADADWLVSGTQISSSDYPGNKRYPRAVPDGFGGLFVAWTAGDPFVQRMTADGVPASGWPIGGARLSALPTGQAVYTLIADGTGGVYVLLSDARNWAQTDFDLYAMRVLANGQLAPGWPAGGFPVCVAPEEPLDPIVTADASGSLIVAWTDSRNARTTGDGADVYGMRILPSGQPAPGWPANGKPIVPPLGSQMAPRLVGDGVGSYLLFYNTGPSFGDDVFVRHIDVNGDPIPGWASDPMPVVIAPGGQGGPAVGDGNGGAYMAWQDTRFTANPSDYDFYEIYAQHVLADGTVAPGWPLDGLPVCAAPEVQWFPRLTPDGSGGVFIAWEDHRNWSVSGPDLYAMRMLPDGSRAPGWAVNGNPISLSVEDHYFPQSSNGIVPDGQGGFYAAFVSDGSYRGWGQRMRGDGTNHSAWSPLGELVPPQPTANLDVVDIAVDGSGGAYMVWHEWRGTYFEVFGTKLLPLGPTAIAVSLVRAEVEPGLVRLAWQASGIPASPAFTLERRSVVGTWTQIATLTPDGSGRIVHDDRVHEPGEYTYRLAYRDEGAERKTAEISVEVPVAYALSLAGFTPNPASGRDLTVAFSLPSTGDASLLLYDVAGRELAREDLRGLSAGRHTIQLGARRQVAPGMYWLRLQHAGHALTSRGVVIQ